MKNIFKSIMITIMIITPIIVGGTYYCVQKFGEKVTFETPQVNVLTLEDVEKLKEYIDTNCSKVYNETDCERLKNEF